LEDEGKGQGLPSIIRRNVVYGVVALKKEPCLFMTQQSNHKQKYHEYTNTKLIVGLFSLPKVSEKISLSPILLALLLYRVEDQNCVGVLSGKFET
jgi:hypothetical protein